MTIVRETVMIRKVSLSVIFVLSFIMAGCWDSASSSRMFNTTYIDDPILLAESDQISPAYTDGDTFVFECFVIPMVRQSEANDFELSYITGSSCDEDVWVYNFKTQAWDQIGFYPGPGFLCFTVISQQSHLFSDKGFKAEDYLNEMLQMKVRGAVGAPKVRALRINPDYFAVPLRVERVRDYYGLTHDRDSLWISSRHPDRLYNVSFEGFVLNEFELPSECPVGLAFDGQFLWLADGINQIFKMTRDGTALCQFSVPTDYPGGLAWGKNQLWLSEYEQMLFTLCSLVSINPQLSCQTGSADVTNTFEIPDIGGRGLAWDGTNILVAGEDSSISERPCWLLKMTPAGEEIQRYELLVKHVQDIAWDGNTVWILNYGLKELRSSDPVISCFKLR